MWFKVIKIRLNSEMNNKISHLNTYVVDIAAPHAVVRSRRPDCQRHGRRYRRQDRDL